MFIPLMKADAAQRLVYGSVDETPDRAGEVLDYATAKAAFTDWSTEMQKASNGLSFGNIRGQHSNIAAGKLIQDIAFDDDAKRIDFVAKIVDDNEWQKVEEGVYTGFSPGGKYAKRWQDGSHKRYTPVVRELSIVDIPCIPSAGFAFIKADGTEESREFVIGKAYEPGNEATLARADDLAKAAGEPKLRKNYVGQARAELIAEEATTALAKMDEPEADVVKEPEVVTDPVAALDAALAKADAVVADPIVVSDVPEQFTDLPKAGAALQLLAKSVGDQPVLAKGLYTLERVGCLLERIGEIANSVSWEEKSENDTDSKLPKMAIEIVGKVRDFLIEMATEETAELLTSITASMPEFDLVIVEDDDMALAASIVDLVKSDTDLMEKAGARNSKGDAAKIQSMHDNAVALGADCGTAEKDALASLATDKDRLEKALAASAPRVEALAEKLEKMAADNASTKDDLAKALAEIEKLKAQPEEPKGVLIVMEKGAGGEDSQPTLADQIAQLPNGRVKQAAIIASVGTRR